MFMGKENIEFLKISTEKKNIVEKLQFLAQEFKGRIAFSTSFGQEDQLITDVILKNNIDIDIFTLDTGRFFEETYNVWNHTNDFYKYKICAYFPDPKLVEELVSTKGPYSFYESVENRKECCNIRKVQPLTRALQDVDLWITGLRAEQSQARAELQFFEYDEGFKTIKFNPLKDYNLNDILNYLTKNNVPYNKLHDQGFISIGCAPCTRAIKQGEDIRAGRWWWEDKSKKECGLHEQHQADFVIQVKKM